VRCCALLCVAVRCSALQCVAVRCSALQCVAVRCSALQCIAVHCSALQCVAVRCSVLQCVAVCCNVLRCVAVFSRFFSASSRARANPTPFDCVCFLEVGNYVTNGISSLLLVSFAKETYDFILCHKCE